MTSFNGEVQDKLDVVAKSLYALEESTNAFARNTICDIQLAKEDFNKEITKLKKTIKIMKIILGITFAVAVAGLFTGCQQYHPSDCTCDDCNLAPIELLYPTK